MSGGRLKIDVLPAGAVVAAFQVLDAVNDGVLDAAHSVPVYWYGKNKAASLFGTGPVFGGSATTMLSWFYEGGGADLYRELTQDIMGLNVIGYMGFPMFAQPFGWFKGEVNTAPILKASSTAPSALLPTCCSRWACRSRSFRAAKSCRRWSAA
jgi:TRAP-type mannitol/chloroaromatic compound transport system substrate-binding protein